MKISDLSLGLKIQHKQGSTQYTVEGIGVDWAAIRPCFDGSNRVRVINEEALNGYIIVKPKHKKYYMITKGPTGSLYSDVWDDKEDRDGACRLCRPFVVAIGEFEFTEGQGLDNYPTKTS